MNAPERRAIRALVAVAFVTLCAMIASVAAAQPGTSDLTPSAVYEQVSPAVVTIRVRGEPSTPSSNPAPQSGTAAGFILDTEGHIVTALHVVFGFDRLDVMLADGSTYRAEVLGIDPGNDLAILTLQAPPEKLAQLPTVRLGDSNDLRVGETVIAIGSPFGLDRTLTMGVISSLGRMRTGVGERLIADMIQVDAPINPGNSGGPLLNLRGEVIGINEQIEGTNSVGIGFAVPVNSLSRYLPDLLASREPRHAWLGISGRALSPAGAETLHMEGQRGVVLGSVAPGGPAANAGLLGSDETGAVGDVIVALDDQPVRSVEEIAQYIDRKAPGDTVRVTYIRDGQTVTAVATLGAWVSPLPPR
jgi:S1-C subfamily serine protease